MMWKQQQWVAVDVETTGLDPKEDRIVELAAVRFHAGRVLERRASLVNPERVIPTEASDVHGIRNADVADAETIAQLAPRFLPIVAAADVVLAYNWPFDASFLSAALGGAWDDALAGKIIVDPLVVIRFDEVGRYWPGKGRHKLGNVAARLGIKVPRSHRSGIDAVTACHVLWTLREHLPDDGREAAALIERARVAQDEQFGAWLAAQPPLEGANP